MKLVSFNHSLDPCVSEISNLKNKLIGELECLVVLMTFARGVLILAWNLPVVRPIDNLERRRRLGLTIFSKSFFHETSLCGL